MKLLHLDSSALGAHSATREITAAIVARQLQRDSATRVVHRDLAAQPLPHLDGAILGGEDPAGAAESAAVLEEFLAADTVVIGAPMYNFGIPSALKAWVDRIAVAGRTFRYTADGPEGLVQGKTVIVAVAAGGLHAARPSDFVEPYLRQVFGFIGVTDLRFVRAEGLAFSPAQRRAAIDAALDDAVDLPRAA
ncbi:FMN-dependent NADH-azoreductase [Lysobacter sp. N42]|uniref:FMN-dependent NADH-azoreductase n=1 Tax=Lysobacter sp. N42 TaxID=2545719 RepID=UPI001046425F|nr:NAD(P)H-dependent oxidoreductase [Lysobacter sp. N42]TCZ88936.1 FMN-dependent NADH-azoreductase [Lysobacter sp. N42]